MVLLHIGGDDPVIIPASYAGGPTAGRWSPKPSAEVRLLPGVRVPIRGRTIPFAAPSHRTAGRAGSPVHGSEHIIAFVAQRIGRPPPEREATGSNPVEGTRREPSRFPSLASVRHVFRFAPPVPVLFNGQHSGLPCRRCGFESRPGLPYAPVSQTVEEAASKSAQCGFESHRGHKVPHHPP